MTYNLHVLLDVPHSVRKFGALWAKSTFLYESYNGALTVMFCNSQSIPQQICESYLRLKSTNQAIHKVFERTNSSPHGTEIIIALLGKSRTKRCDDYDPYMRVFDVPGTISLTLRQRLLIEQLLGEEIADVGYTYKRFIFRNILYHGTVYKLSKRKNSTI